MPDNAWKYRESFQRAADEAYHEHGEDQGWSGIVPYEVLEAIASRESGGDPKARNQTPMPNGEHATGLMQIVPGLGIAWTYESIEGAAPTEQELYDPDQSAYIAAVALSEKAKDVQRTGWFGYGDQAGERIPLDQGQPEGSGPDWGTVGAIAWFGAGQQDGYGFWQPLWEVTDGPTGISGRDWAEYVQKYAAGFGPEIERQVMAGAWRNPSDPERKSWNKYSAWTEDTEGITDWPLNFIEGKYDGTRAYIDDKVDDLTGNIAGQIGAAIEAALPRVGMVAAGLVLFAGGILAVRTMAMKAAIGG